MAQADRSQPADTEVTPVPQQSRAADGRAARLDQSFDREALVALRSAVAAYGGSLGLRGERLEMLIVVAHELATNAVRHGGGRGRLLLWRDGDRVCCRVTDDGPGLDRPDVASWSSPPPVQVEGGRGL